MEESQTGGLQSLILQCRTMNNSHTNIAFSEIPLSVCSGFGMAAQLLICSHLLGVFNFPKGEVLSQGTGPRKPPLSVAFSIARKGLTSLGVLSCGGGVCSRGLGWPRSSLLSSRGSTFSSAVVGRIRCLM